MTIGLVNTAFGYMIFALFYVISGDHRLSITVATIIGVIFNFFTTGRIVFQNRDNFLIFRFIGGYVVSLAVNIVLLETVTRFGTHALVAQIICLLPVVVLTYFINSIFVFRGASN